MQVRVGFYVYIGSAFGPGGVRARVAHHCRASDRPHWHIDYLKGVLQLKEICWTHDPVRREHQWAAAVQHQQGASIPLQGFGASDCDCVSHLFFFTVLPSFAKIAQSQPNARPH
jgi:Uri superfamily endonuclease